MSRLCLNLTWWCISKFVHGNNHLAQCQGRYFGIIDIHASVSESNQDGKVDQKIDPIFYNHSFYGQMPKSSSKVFFYWTLFHVDLYCCVKYSSVEYQDEIFKRIIKSNVQKQMLKFGFGRKFHDLNYFEFFFHNPWIQYKLEVIIRFKFILFF